VAWALLFIWSVIGAGASYLRLADAGRSRVFTLASLFAWGLFAATLTYPYWWPFPLPEDLSPPGFDIEGAFYGLVGLILGAVWFLVCAVVTLLNLFFRDPVD
jgi:hypothetical protein